jgi:O-antigen ligase
MLLSNHYNGIGRAAMPMLSWSALTLMFFVLAAGWLFRDDALHLLLVAAMFLTLLYFVSIYNQATYADRDKSIFRLALVIWWFVLVSHELYERVADPDDSIAGQFVGSAYAEAVTWAIALGAVLSLTALSPHYLTTMLKGSWKWLTVFALVCTASIVYAPNAAYSLAWLCKLWLVVLCARMCHSHIRNENDIWTFFRITLWGFLFLTVLPAIRALADPSTAFEGAGDRLNANPDALSPAAATALLLVLMLCSFSMQRHLVFFGVIATIIMFFALGKTGILAGIFATIVFLLLQGRLRAAMWLGMSMAALVGILFLGSSTFSGHIRSYEGTATLSGRTFIWDTAVPAVKQRIFTGHGYVSSRFVSVEVPDEKMAIDHLHNSLLETLYNTGVVGLTLILIINATIFINLVRAIAWSRRLKRIRGPDDQQAYNLHLLSVGCLALYINEFVNGMFNASFGGRVLGPFMMVIALLSISEPLAHRVRSHLLSPLSPQQQIAASLK